MKGFFFMGKTRETITKTSQGTTRETVLKALFIALHVVLCYLTIRLWNMNITLSGLPIIIGAALFGPVAGLEIGLIGSFLAQILQYGFTATTLLWIIPAGVRGLTVGWYAMKKHYTMTKAELTAVVIVSSLLVTIINTVVMYLDSVIYGYFSYAYVFGALAFRLLSALITSVIYVTLTIPFLQRKDVLLYGRYNG